MRNAVQSRNGTNIEELAAKAKAEREQKCTEAVLNILEQFNCEMQICLQVGQQTVPLGQIIVLPGVVMVKSR